MKTHTLARFRVVIGGPLVSFVLLAMESAFVVSPAIASNPQPTYTIRVDSPHRWRPPFGLDRLGQPIVAVVDASDRPPRRRYRLAALLHGKELGRYPVEFPSASVPPYSVRLKLDGFADELVLSVDGEPLELARVPLKLSVVEAGALARADAVTNPVDLGTILVPSGWLLLGPNQSAILEVAAISRHRDYLGSGVRAAFESAPGRFVSAVLPLRVGQITRRHLELGRPTHDRDRDILRVELDDGAGGTLWRGAIPVMLVSAPPPHPRFGATYEHLRYDAPISLKDPATGAYSEIPYEKGWKPELRDVVVWLPNGARFVFWRGSSFIPFWAGRRNTGLCYEWAEIISQPQGAVDCVEPLMDKELRYGRVEIRDHRVDARPRTRALELPIDRFSLQGLGRRGRRRLLFLP
jgi:hypothetical protein